MTVAVEPEIQAQRREGVILREELPRTRGAEPQLVAIQGNPFHLLKHLREVDGGIADFGRNLRQRPPSCGVARENEFRPIREPLASKTSARRMGGPQSQGSSGERQREAFSLERLREPLSKAVPQQRDERLRPRIDPKTLPPRGSRRTLAPQIAWRQLTEHRRADGETQAGITSGHRMTDSIPFTRVEKQHLIRFGDRLITTEMTDEHATIGEYQFRGDGPLFRARMRLVTLAADIANRDGIRLEETLRNNLRHSQDLASVYSLLPPTAERPIDPNQ